MKGQVLLAVLALLAVGASWSNSPRADGATTTRIVIDGNSQDWSSYPIVVNDREVDNQGGGFDITTVRAFTNDAYLYVLVETSGPRSNYVQLDLEIVADQHRYVISFRPEEGSGGHMGEVTQGGWIDVGDIEGSQSVGGQAVEIKIPLTAFKGIRDLTLVDVRPMAGVCCGSGWHAVDHIPDQVAIPRGDELEPSGTQYALAQQFRLPAGYVAQCLFAPPAPNLNGIATSKNGTVYLIWGGTGLDAGISTLDPNSGKVTLVLRLPSGYGYDSAIVGGPGDTAFVPVANEIWQVSPDGSHKIWSAPDGARPKFYQTNGHLLASSSGGFSALDVSPEGTVRAIAWGFHELYDIVALRDGAILISDTAAGSLTRIEPDGAKHVLAKDVLRNDPMDLGLGPDGSAYMMTVVTGFVGIDPLTGRFTPYLKPFFPCTIHPADFTFSDQRVLFVDPTFGQVAWADLDTGETGLLVASGGANTWATDIGPDGALYVGASGCWPAIPAQVLRIRDDGTRQVYLDGLRGPIEDIAFAPDGGLYVAAQDRADGSPRTFYVPKGGGSTTPKVIDSANGLSSITVDPKTGHLFGTRRETATVFEFSTTRQLAEYPIRLPKAPWEFEIDFAPDGTLYACVSESERQQTGPVVSRWVLALDAKKGTSRIVFESDWQGCCVMGNLCVDPQGTIWWLVDPEKYIYRVEPDGRAALVARNLPIDPAGIAADAQGDVYFTSPGGIFRIYREQ